MLDLTDHDIFMGQFDVRMKSLKLFLLYICICVEIPIVKHAGMQAVHIQSCWPGKG